MSALPRLQRRPGFAETPQPAAPLNAGARAGPAFAALAFCDTLAALFVRTSMVAHYWFRAKRYGLGWGFPLTWEGWAVQAAFIVLVVADGFVFPPGKARAAFIACAVGLSALLLAVCWLKGEPPRWRWGDDDQPKA